MLGWLRATLILFLLVVTLIMLRLNSKVLVTDRRNDFLIFAAIIFERISDNRPLRIIVNFVIVSLISKGIISLNFEQSLVFCSYQEESLHSSHNESVSGDWSDAPFETLD
jgi:hypothetical protein